MNRYSLPGGDRMRGGKVLLANAGLLLSYSAVLAQLPPLPQPPAVLPRTESSNPTILSSPQNLDGLAQSRISERPRPANPVAQSQEIPFPYPENKISIKPMDISVKRIGGSWQLWAGQQVLRNFGEHELDARDAARVFQDLRPTEWVTIGHPRPIVEYGLVNGRPAMAATNPSGDELKGQSTVTADSNNRPVATGTGAKQINIIDLRTVRVEAIRGTWCLRDDVAIHCNFGPIKSDADQALAAVLRYGFNRIGVIGHSTPLMTYFFVGPETGPIQKTALTALSLQAQIDSLTRVGIPVPGVGYVGEMIRFDPKKLEVRKEGSNWIIAVGNDIFGNFGPSEWAARDAVRTIEQLRVTEFCKVGSVGLTFFLVDGKAPRKVPFSTQVRQFDLESLKVQQYGERWAVTENGRHLFDCVNADEGEVLIRVLKAFKFNQLCHLGPSARLGISFFAQCR
jgi:hypothetical protein